MDIKVKENKVIDLIDKALQDNEVIEMEKNPRDYMECSALGMECDKALWIRYNKKYTKKHDGRVLRIWMRGKDEEKRIVKLLKMAGCKLKGTGRKQIEVQKDEIKGHLDGIILSGIPEAPKTKHILEMKTYNEKRFNELEKVGVMESDPIYYTQCQVYMYLSKIDRCLFFAICKNDDRIHVERLALDKDFAEMRIERALDIARTDTEPMGLNGASPMFFKCKICEYYGYCYGD